MIYITNECCNCAAPGYPCMGASCFLRRYINYKCDKCGAEVEEGELYKFDNEELCIDCIKERLEVVEYDE